MMDFVFCTDKKYLKGYGVLMLSIMHFNPLANSAVRSSSESCLRSPMHPGSKFSALSTKYPPPMCTERLRFHVLSDCLDANDKAALEDIASRRENTQVSFYEPSRLLPKETLALISKSLIGQARFTKEAYYRILAADLLPPDARRALYLDGDVLCAGPLDGLFALDLKGAAVAMCPDIIPSPLPRCNKLGYHPRDGYFNSGVMLMDIDLWRRESLSRAMFGYLAANLGKQLYYDQDVINAVLHGRVRRLDFSYNVMSPSFYVFYWLEEEKNGYYAEQTQFLPKEEWPALLAAVERPRLVHMIEPKPWLPKSAHPFARVWRHFYAQSPWKGERLRRCSSGLPAKARIKRLGRRALQRIGLVSVLTPPFPKEAYRIAQGILDELNSELRT